MANNLDESKYDIEWVKLIKEAKGLGLTREQVLLFLTKCEERPISR